MKGPEPKRVEIQCPACGRESWLVRKPVFTGFTKTGENQLCALCGHLFAPDEEIPFRNASAPSVFSEEDRPRPVKVFDAAEKGRMCRYCAEYVVNPFIQRCGRHRCEVEATDTCPHFRPKAPPRENPLSPPADTDR